MLTTRPPRPPRCVRRCTARPSSGSGRASLAPCDSGPTGAPPTRWGASRRAACPGLEARPATRRRAMPGARAACRKHTRPRRCCRCDPSRRPAAAAPGGMAPWHLAGSEIQMECESLIFGFRVTFFIPYNYHLSSLCARGDAHDARVRDHTPTPRRLTRARAHGGTRT